MKKALALALALVLAFSCMTVAFAAEPTTKQLYNCAQCGPSVFFNSAEELNAHIKDAHAPTEAASVDYICPWCGVEFATESTYSAHVGTLDEHGKNNGTCPEYKDEGTGLPVNFFDMAVSEMLTYLLSVIDLDNERLGILAPIIQRIIDFVENLIAGVIAPEEAGVEGVSADLNSLESKLAGWGLNLKDGKLKSILDGIKAKIKALYCGEPATTAAEKPAETGSASTGIAVFAAVSVAAAAAYVCTKKRA